MNRILIQFSLLAVFVFTQCKSVNHINIIQKTAIQKVIIRAASDNENSIITIQFPKWIILTNQFSKNYDMLTINYKYYNTPSNRNSNLGLYVSKTVS